MPKDKRLYMTFPIDFHRHPKLRRLPVEVRWTFVEMNGEARLADNDGIFSAEDAEFEWPVEHLQALASSHPVRPLVTYSGTHYTIRDYAEHQETRARREERRARNAENGAKGGRPPKNPPGTDSKPSGFPVGTESQPTGTQPKAESESESELETSKTSTSQSSSKRARERTDSGYTSKITERLAKQAGIQDPSRLAVLIHDHLGVDVHWDHLAMIVNHLASKSKTPVTSGVGYAITCIRETPEEVRQFIYENGLAI